MRVFFFYSICLLSFTSCRSKIPGNVVPPKQMQALLWDMMQADELATINITKDSSFAGYAKHAAYYDTVFSIHHISPEQFKTSIGFYANHPEILKPILDSIQSAAERLQHPNAPSPASDSFARKRPLNINP